MFLAYRGIQAQVVGFLRELVWQVLCSCAATTGQAHQKKQTYSSAHLRSDERERAQWQPASAGCSDSNPVPAAENFTSRRTATAIGNDDGAVETKATHCRTKVHPAQ